MGEAVEKDYAHIPVLWREVMNYVKESSFAGQGYFVDCTLGEGGHSGMLLESFPDLRIIAFERDAEILEIARKRLAKFGDRIECIHANFSELPEHLDERNIKAAYILYDFGISSFHFDRSGRGFSFRDDEPLDMRLNATGQDLDAAYVINHYTREKLADIFYRYGEERWSRRIATVLCDRRQEKDITTSGELASIVLGAIPRKFHVKNIHPATRVFQALRIEVNDELTAIDAGISAAYRYCVPGGRIMAISFHSLEDRIVKNRFRELARGCTCGREPKHCICTDRALVSILTKKPVIPGEEEMAVNNRARSAKLRVCERL